MSRLSFARLAAQKKAGNNPAFLFAQRGEEQAFSREEAKGKWSWTRFCQRHIVGESSERRYSTP